MSDTPRPSRLEKSRGPIRPDPVTAAKFGERYLNMGEAREGMTVVVDAGFTCMAEGEKKVIRRDQTGDLYIDCADGGHSLVGQLDVDNALIGIFPVDGALCK